MDDSFLYECYKAITNLLQYFDGVRLTDVLIFVDELFQIAVAYLLDDVVIFATLHDVHHLHYVLRFE